MRQLQITAIDPEVEFAFAEVPVPEPKKRQLLIEVAAAGINPADWNFAGSEHAPLPHPIGLDVAGTVVAVGEEVDTFAVGERVAGQAPMRAGAVAPYTVARRSALAPLPGGVTFEQGATLGTAAEAAWAALIEEAELAAGQTVLVHGGGGAVGSFAVQIARHRGASVTATASLRHVELLRELGVDRHVDYTATAFEDTVDGVDVVLDTIGGETFLRSLEVLRDGGTMVSVAYFDEPPADTVARKRLWVRQISMRPNRERLETLAAMVVRGELRLVIGTHARMSEAVPAIRDAMRGHNQGNIVISVP